MAKTLGIDVSRWQNNISTTQKMDFTKARTQGARFVFIKSSQADYADRDILYNWASAKAAGLLRGAYHFLTWDVDPKAQAQFAWSLIKNDPGELPPVVDFESWGIVPANVRDKLWNYLSEMERLCGRKPIIYTGTYFWDEHSTQAAGWKDYPLWIAYYGAEENMLRHTVRMTPWDKPTFWQYTNKGDGLAFGAESYDLDLNYFFGDYDELLKFAGISAPPVVIPPTTDYTQILSDLIAVQNHLDTIIKNYSQED